MSPLSIERPIQAEAYNLALMQLAAAAPGAVSLPEVIDTVMGAVLDLSSAGQRDVNALARYAANRGQAVYQIRRR